MTQVDPGLCSTTGNLPQPVFGRRHGQPEVLTLSGYHRIEKALRERGFTQDMRADAPICRWQVEGVTVDVMPAMEEILGFANRRRVTP